MGLVSGVVSLFLAWVVVQPGDFTLPLWILLLNPIATYLGLVVYLYPVVIILSAWNNLRGKIALWQVLVSPLVFLWIFFFYANGLQVTSGPWVALFGGILSEGGYILGMKK